MKVFLLIFNISLVISITTYSYSPESLAKAIKNGSNYYFPNVFFDPDNYIKNFSKIINLQKEILEKNKIYTLIGIIYKTNYYSLERFTYDFVQEFYYRNKTYTYNSIAVILVNAKRDIWIVTGKTAQNEYSDKTIDYLLDEMTPKLKTKDYRAAFELLLNGILNIKITKIKANLGIIISVSIVCIIVLLLILYIIFCNYYLANCCNCCYKKRKLTKSEQIYINRLEEFLNNIEKDETALGGIYTDYCVICLYSFDQNIPAIDEELSFDDFVILDIPDKKYPLINDENNEKQNEKYDFMKKTTLECGHSFHKKCINELLEKNEKCPICKELLNISIDPAEIQQKIINIQKIAKPLIKNYGFYYEKCKMKYKTTPRVYPEKNKFFTCCEGFCSSSGGGGHSYHYHSSHHSHSSHSHSSRSHRSGGGGRSHGGGGRHF